MIRNHNGQERRFKKNDCPEQSRRNREATTIELRKKKQEERLKSRRMTSTETGTNPVTTAGSSAFSSVVQNDGGNGEIQKQINDCMDIFVQWKENPYNMLDKFLEAVKEIRRLLSIANNPPVDLVLQAGALPYLFDALRLDDSRPDLQFQGAWAITNIASTSRTKDVAEHSGLVIELARLLGEGKTSDVREQCAWCLGNIAGESKDYRNALLEIGSVRNNLLINLREPETDSLLGNIAWAVSNLLRASSHLPTQTTRGFVKPLIDQLSVAPIENDNLLADICYALGYLGEDEPEKGERASILLIHNAHIVLMEVLEKVLSQPGPSTKVIVPLVRCLGMFACGSTEQTGALLGSGFLKHVHTLLKLGSKAVQKETTWVCSNIAAGTVDHAGILAKDMAAMGEITEGAVGKHFDVRRESIYTLCNLLANDIDQHTYKVVEAGVIPAFCSNLETPDADLLLSILDSLEIIFKYNAKIDGTLVLQLDEEGGIDKIETLLQHRNDHVYQKAYKLIEEYLGIEPDVEDEDDQNLCPAENGDSYSFGLTSKQLFVDGDNGQVAQVAFDFGPMGDRDQLMSGNL